MFCPRCGSQSSDNTVFCAYCGTRIDGNDRKEQPTSQQQQKHPGESSATSSLVCGIIGLFVLWFVLSIVAIVQGNKAKKLGYTGGTATAGTILGWIGVVLGIIGTVYSFILLAAMSAEGWL
ncbi:MAG: zinc-ribbon domain-containing protein [Chloroflexi bacterium]|nr:zinc-ribbon domain-containing protein [Chloroflexota bacterium]